MRSLALDTQRVIMPDFHSELPKPGSPEAVKRGCTCPTKDNGCGRGYSYTPDGLPLYWIEPGCPLHGKKSEEEGDGD